MLLLAFATSLATLKVNTSFYTAQMASLRSGYRNVSSTITLYPVGAYPIQIVNFIIS